MDCEQCEKEEFYTKIFSSIITTAVLVIIAFLMCGCLDTRDQAVKYCSDGMYRAWHPIVLERIRTEAIIDYNEFRKCIVQYMGSHKDGACYSEYKEF